MCMDIAFYWASLQLQTIRHSHGGFPIVVSDVYWDDPPNPDNHLYNNGCDVAIICPLHLNKQLPLVLVLSLLIWGSMCRAIGVGIGLSCNFVGYPR